MISEFFLVILFVLAFAVRFYLLKFHKPSFDNFGHLYFSKQLKKHGRGPLGPIPVDVELAKPVYNPFFYNWLMVHLLGIRKLIKYEGLINSIVDLLFSILIIIMMQCAGYSLRLSLWTVLLYVSSPLWSSMKNSGPRLNGFSPRLFSEICVMTYFFIAYENLGLDIYFVNVILIVLSIILFSTSKFGTQALIFISLTTALMEWSFFPIIPVFIGMILWIILSRGVGLKLLRHQLKHLKWYFRLNANGEISASKRNNFGDYWYRSKSFLWNLRRFLTIKSFHNGFLAGGLMIPFFIPLLLIFILFPEVANQNNFYHPVLAAIIVYLLTNFRYLLFIGESERYLNHVAILICVVFVSSFSSLKFEWVIPLMVTLNFLFLFDLVRKLRIEGIDTSTFDLNQKITSYLMSMPNPQTIICYPYHFGSYFQILLETKHKMFGSILTDYKTHPITVKKLELEYPFLDLSRLNEMSNNYGVSVLVYKDVLNQSWLPPSNWELIKTFEEGLSIYINKDNFKSD